MLNKLLLTKFVSASLLISTCGAMDSAKEMIPFNGHSNQLEAVHNPSNEDFIQMGDMRFPRGMCVWNPATQTISLDFSKFPNIAKFMGSQFSADSQNNSSVLQIEDTKEEKVITSLSLTLEQLKIGYEKGSFVLEDGTKWEVRNGNTYGNTPSFYSYDSVSLFYGDYHQSTDEFRFTYITAFGGEVWNEQEQRMIEDCGSEEVFNLIVKRSK